MAFRQSGRDIATRMRLLLLLLGSKITHIYFSFFIRARYACLFLSSHGSSLIGLPFPPSCCLSVVFVHVTCAGY